MLTEQKSVDTMDMNSEQSPLNGGTNTNQKDNSNYSRVEIEKTPFTLINTGEGQHFIVLGEHRLSDIVESAEEAMESMETWNFKTNLIAAMIEITNRVKNLTEKGE